jgi:hypothetical protein
MQKSYEWEVVTHIGPESCGAAGKSGVEALTGERAGRVYSRVRTLPPGRRRCRRNRKAPSDAPISRGVPESRAVTDPLQVQNAIRTPSREDALSALERVRQAASKDKKLRFTALLHHIYNLETLRRAYFSWKKEAASGEDGETWRHYGETLEDNLQDLSRRLKRGAYRAKPARRVYIPKADGRQRPLGVPVLEDKIVQRAAVEVLNAIYQTDFLGVPLNRPALWLFRFQVGWLWQRALSRRSQNGHVLWDRMRRLINRWLPMPVICHPYPLRRMGVIT